MTQLSDPLPIALSGPVRGTIRPPGSKSITNRALICASLATGTSVLTGALDSEDTRVMVDGLARLGLKLNFDAAAERIVVHGGGGQFPAHNADLYCANAGTTIRFLSALVATLTGEFRLDGSPRMRERPIGDLLAALRQFGVDARSERSNDCPPVLIRANGLAGGHSTVRGTISSQFLSGLMLAAPYAHQDVELTVEGGLVSQPYVEITRAVMAAFGVRVESPTPIRYTVRVGQRYQPREYAVEPDASAASYFWGAAAVTGGEITVAGLSRNALQGDVAFVDCLASMGCQVRESADGLTVIGGPLRGIDVDMNAISDTAQTLATIALFAAGPTTLRGIAHNRHKETDRIGNLAHELRKLGASVEELPDGLRITPGSLQGAEIETYHDHRMAMSLALAGLKVPGVTIRNPGCTGKTYPNFFADLAKVCTTASATS